MRSDQLYPGALWTPSRITHPMRPQTRGIVIHETYGHEAGDVATLRGPEVDVQFLVGRSGRVYQFVPLRSQAWHAMATANRTCIGIEHTGSGEAWTAAQLLASARLAAWLCRRYNIPIVHVHPPGTWWGIMGHVDLRGIDGNDHTDSVPAGIGWDRYLAQIRLATNPAITLRARLMRAGLGRRSADAILAALHHTPTR